jgi:hypothetical protein
MNFTIHGFSFYCGLDNFFYLEILTAKKQKKTEQILAVLFFIS